MKYTILRICTVFFVFGVLPVAAVAQGTAFTYQGRLTDAGPAANGQYDLVFKLFAQQSGGAQIGVDLERADVQVTDGIFTVTLDFGSSPFTGSSANYLEIAVRPGASSGSYTPLSPRQQITSSPYSISTIRAQTAALADNASQLGGILAAGYVQDSDPRMTDARTPLAGSGDYIQNIPFPLTQPGNFSVSGTGSSGIFNAATQYNIGGQRVLANNGFQNIVAGVGSGAANAGANNSFFGYASGANTTTGFFNTFVGSTSGHQNLTGFHNSFLGGSAGQSNSSGNRNSFFGVSAGFSNGTGSDNTMIGRGADVSAPDLNFATAIGAGSVVSSSNTVVLGRSADTIRVPGSMNISGPTIRFDQQLVSLLRWDLLPSNRIIPVGPSPAALAFDGTFLYVARATSPGTILRIRSNTGVVEGSPITVGNGANALAHDGTFIYSANNLEGTVTRIRASTGTVEGGPITVGTEPNALAFDGTFMYVVNGGSNNVMRIRASTGLIEGSPIAVGSLPAGIAFDGTFIYVSNNFGSSVTRIRASTGAVEGGAIAVGSSPYGLAFDGTFIYVANAGSSSVTRIRASTGVVDGSPIAVGTVPRALAFDGTFMYVANISSLNVSRIRASTGIVEGPAFVFGGEPRALAFDGSSMFVLNGSTNVVIRF